MRMLLMLAVLCGSVCVSGCFGKCDDCAAPPPPPPPRPAVVQRAPVVRPAPPPPPAVCDPCAGF